MSVADTLRIEPRGEREVVITRAFDAPRALVWEALARPELLRRWLAGPPGWTMTGCENDMRVGGAFRCGWSHENGNAMALSGTYLEVERPARLVRTERFEFGCETQAGEQHCTLELSERDGRTTLTLLVVYPSRQARDGTLRSGMEHGMRLGYGRIDELLADGAAAS